MGRGETEVGEVYVRPKGAKGAAIWRGWRRPVHPRQRQLCRDASTPRRPIELCEEIGAGPLRLPIRGGVCLQISSE